jgi:hypothetical protein
MDNIQYRNTQNVSNKQTGIQKIDTDSFLTQRTFFVAKNSNIMQEYPQIHDR